MAFLQCLEEARKLDDSDATESVYIAQELMRTML